MRGSKTGRAAPAAGDERWWSDEAPRWKGPPPPSLVLAARLMLVLAFLALVAGVARAIPGSDHNTTHGGEAIVSIGAGVVEAAVWGWMATANRAGQLAARAVSMLLFALYTGAVIAFLFESTPGWVKVVSWVAWAPALAVMVLILLPSSGEYYDRRGALRPPDEPGDDPWANEVLRRPPKVR